MCVCVFVDACKGKFNVVRTAVLMEALAQQNADDGSTYWKAGGGAAEGLGQGSGRWGVCGGGRLEVHSMAARGSHAKGGVGETGLFWKCPGRLQPDTATEARALSTLSSADKSFERLLGSCHSAGGGGASWM